MTAAPTREKRWIWFTDANAPNATPQVEEVWVRPGTEEAEDPEFLRSPPWEDAPAQPRKVTTLARTQVNGESPKVHLPRKVLDHLRLRRGGKLVWCLTSEGEVIVRRAG